MIKPDQVGASLADIYRLIDRCVENEHVRDALKRKVDRLVRELCEEVRKARNQAS